jgi:chorismate lyase/3-hydroxybenzoate synthase
VAVRRVAAGEPSRGHLLASIGHGAVASVTEGVVSTGLTSRAPFRDELLAGPSPRRWREGDIQFAASDEILFAAVATRDLSDLAATTDALYTTVLRRMREDGYVHVLRIWNAVPDINGDDGGLERYRRFSVGRAMAFGASGMFAGERYPASTAVGSRDGAFVAYFLAARSPGVHVENPDQVPAHRYPPLYGPKSPLFCRAVVTDWGEDAVLFLAGTASITGHESQHAGDVVAQATLAAQNVRTVVEAARRTTGRTFATRDGIYTAYIRNDGDEAAVQRVFASSLGAVPQVVVADICRPELLVEIDAVLTVRR